MRNRIETLGPVARVAISGLNHAILSQQDRADFYEGLSTFLPKPESEAARYASTCIRECERAQRDFLKALETKKGGTLKMSPEIFEIRRELAMRKISAHAVATRLGVDPRHLARVLNGERPGSRALLRAVAEHLETIPIRRPQQDTERLIAAAVHVFFLQRARFQSSVFEEAIYQPQKPKFNGRRRRCPIFNQNKK